MIGPEQLQMAARNANNAVQRVRVNVV